MNTTTDTTATVQTLPLTALAGHPDNVRTTLGDLTDLARSIKTSGILIPLLALPADANGIHYVIAGNRRLAAAQRAGITDAPVIVRDLTPVEVLDAMLTENGHRADLTLGDSIRAVARYQVVAPSETPTKIGKRIGRTAAWVKDRLALAVLPGNVLDLLDTGTITMGIATALSAATAELDDTELYDLALEANRNRWREPDQIVAAYLKKRAADARLAALVAKLDAKGITRYSTRSEALAAKAVQLDASGLGLDPAAQRAHRHEPCHAVTITTGYEGAPTVTGWCTMPKRHRTNSEGAAASPIAVQQYGEKSDAAAREKERAHRSARDARATAAAAMFAAAKMPKADGINLAARVIPLTMGSEQIGKVCAWLDIDTTIPEGAWHFDAAAAIHEWLDNGGDPYRLIGMIAAATIESYGRKSDPLPGQRWAAASTAWLDTLTYRAGYVSEGHDL